MREDVLIEINTSLDVLIEINTSLIEEENISLTFYKDGTYVNNNSSDSGFSRWKMDESGELIYRHNNNMAWQRWTDWATDTVIDRIAKQVMKAYSDWQFELTVLDDK